MASTVDIGGGGTLFVGEDKTFTLELVSKSTQQCVDMDGMTVVFDVRATDTAKSAIFEKVATLVGTYDPVRAVNTQRARVVLSDVELNTVKARTYRYSWKREDANFEIVFARGDFTPEKATAP